MDEKIRIFALGGLDEEGKNCYCLEIDDELYVLDCGVRDPDKTMPGVDYVIPRFDYLVENKSRIKAYFLTHGHDDCIGAIPYIYAEAPAPIYGSKVTLSMLKMFNSHIKKNIDFDFHVVDPTSNFKVGKREISFFHTAHNIAGSSGVSISTSKGNVVFMSDFVIENAASPSYLNDLNAIAKIAERPTLALMPESIYAGRPGYTAPLYKLTPHIEETIKNAEGRIFISLFSNDLYNVSELIALAIANKKKIVCYDESVASILETLQACGELLIPRENYASLDDVLRLRDQDTVVLMMGFGSRLFRKIALLASGQNEDKRIRLKPSDTFIIASMSDDNSEIEYTDAADELFRSGCKVKLISKKQFLRMHASEEDLKMMVSLLKPKYYIPVRGLYKDLLHNGMLALSMGVNLNHQNVFVMENGSVVTITSKGAKMDSDVITHGDLLIDGEGIGDVSKQVLDDRAKLAEGVVLLSLTVDKKARKIIAGPDIQMRGFLFSREAEMIGKEISKVFTTTVTEFLEKPIYNSDEMKQNVYERCFRVIRRTTGKEPMVIPLIVEI